jgi:putative Mn2+ efflux pump MntP
MLDIRIPIGLMFGTFGIILMLFGLFSTNEIYETHSLGINVNLWWGLAMLVFAGLMLLLSRWKKQN